MGRVFKNETVNLGTGVICARVEKTPASVTASRQKHVPPKAEAQTGAGEILESARLQGENQGSADGERVAREEFSAQAESALEAIRRDAEEERAHLTADHEAAMSGVSGRQQELAMELTRRIVNLVLGGREDAFQGLFHTAASHIPHAERAVLYAGPKSCGFARLHREELMKCVDGLDELEIVCEGADEGLCILETTSGSVDASVPVQLAKAGELFSAMGGGDRA